MLGNNPARLSGSGGGPIRLTGVSGFEGRVNDVIYCPPLQKPSEADGEEPENTAVVYFGGDIQDFPENMQVHRDSKAYIKYNLENTALMLRNNFPKSHIVIIKAVRMEFKTFSCYDNFVRGCNAGIPDHTPMNHALQHLEKLLQNIPVRIRSIPESELISQMTAFSSSTSATATTTSTATATSSTVTSNAAAQDTGQDMDIDILQVQDTVNVESDSGIGFTCKDNSCNSIPRLPTDLSLDLLQAAEESVDSIGVPNASDLLWWREGLNLDKATLTLIAFSKGSVVLNQFIYEFHYLKTLTPDDSSMMRLVSRIRDMYWLDGGHSAPKNTWITSRSLLETLTRLNINLHVHVTPYQVLDDRRPWIRRDEKAFTDLLKRLGAPLTRILHFDSGVTNLFTHFEVLEVFRQARVEPPAQPEAVPSEATQSTSSAPATSTSVLQETGNAKNAESEEN
ncbi:mitochondrial protein C2orf69 homolog isoform X2 [Phlebotomus papatasi]|uniref:mitochondrial protein C2orf69 homolog isoform X2 n=1 Tax=Phlebotomus papatasi TaxID=29031 RepID=UPI0024840706|nr:mitochondrial protein C2orf69 homolog isoform X2 [Phlebotomus papatasi]XP_055708057.1 mitochondrial protein C2orf69 homolog isoform X2 [Phlebotomus papatasi]